MRKDNQGNDSTSSRLAIFSGNDIEFPILASIACLHVAVTYEELNSDHIPPDLARLTYHLPTFAHEAIFHFNSAQRCYASRGNDSSIRAFGVRLFPARQVTFTLQIPRYSLNLSTQSNLS